MWDGFWFLSGQRTYHMAGPNPIGVGDMGAYLVTVGIESVDSREFYLRAWGAMDRAFIEYHGKATEKKRETDGEGEKKPKPRRKGR